MVNTVPSCSAVDARQAIDGSTESVLSFRHGYI
jgi:hypothetical protein